MVFIAFSSRGVTVEKSHESFDHDSIDRIQGLGPGFSLFPYESLLSKVYRRDTRESSSKSRSIKVFWFVEVANLR